LEKGIRAGGCTRQKKRKSQELKGPSRGKKKGQVQEFAKGGKLTQIREGGETTRRNRKEKERGRQEDWGGRPNRGEVLANDSPAGAAMGLWEGGKLAGVRWGLYGV